MTSPSDTNEWAAAMAAFDAWAELPEAQRGAWLADLATAQPALHARVVSLIRADRDAQDLSFLSPGDAAAVSAAESLEGKRLGPWLIERLIGQGGMGSVWLARRTDGRFEGFVAIKFLNAGLALPTRRPASASRARAASWRGSRTPTSHACSTPAWRAAAASPTWCSSTSRRCPWIATATSTRSTVAARVAAVPQCAARRGRTRPL